MPTSQNSENTRLSSLEKSGRIELQEGSITNKNTSKGTYTTIRYGNDHGSINFGHIHKQGDVIADVMLQASDGRHSIILDKDGLRQGSTQITAPGRITIDAGLDKKEPDDTLFIHSHNGNIDIIASNGKIRLQGTDIEMIAVGEGGSKGNIRIESNENIDLKANTIQIDAKNYCKLATPGTLELAANSQLTIYASLIRGVTDAVANKDSKVGGRSVQSKNLRG